MGFQPASGNWKHGLTPILLAASSYRKWCFDGCVISLAHDVYCHCGAVALWQPAAQRDAVAGPGRCRVQKGLQGIEDKVDKPSAAKIEEQPVKPQLKEEAKPAEAEPAAK